MASGTSRSGVGLCLAEQGELVLVRRPASESILIAARLLVGIRILDAIAA
jgi:hypothetical protein